MTWQVATLFTAPGAWCRDLSGDTPIGIDEISRKRGHVYVANVYGLASRRLLWSAEGRSRKTLLTFFEAFAPELTSNLIGICCDVWHLYIGFIKGKASQFLLVFDKFYIVQHLTNAVDQFRREEIRDKGGGGFECPN